MKTKIILGSLSVLFLITTSCVSSRKIKYFDNIPETSAAYDINSSNFDEPIIQSDDILVINVNTIDNAASNIINSGNSPTPLNGAGISNSVSQQLISGYNVDKEGFVEIPLLGRIKLAGLTTLKAKEIIREKAAQFYKDPAVNIRFANFKITVIGEVNRPSTYAVPNERVSILDAIGYAGDLTVYGKRENITLIRKRENGTSIAVKLDLTKKEVFNSPYFYLRQNDVVYVEPLRAKLTNSDTSVIRYLGLIASFASVAILIFTNR